MCLRKMQVLDKLHSDMNYSVVSCEFNSNESIMYVKSSIYYIRCL